MKFLLGVFLTTLSSGVFSAPWIEPDDLALRSDIQYLADAGIITVPVTTFPLMWASITPDIKNVDITQLNSNQHIALLNIKRHLSAAFNKPHRTGLKLYGATAARRLTSYGHNDFDKAKIELSQEYMDDKLAGKIQVNYRSGIEDKDPLNQGNSVTVDGSYLAAKLDNWVLSVAAVDRWWGPGLDTSLIMSNNARPLPAISVTRNNSQAFETPWLSWIGPWTFTAQMAVMETDRVVANPYLFSSRGTFRPLRGLEIGASWSYQWAGEGQPDSVKDFVKGLLGETECPNGAPSCDDSMLSNLGNQLAGVDIRWSDIVFGIPYAVYGQTIGEDSSGPGQIADKAMMYGAETRFHLFEQRFWLNLEYADTQVNCGPEGDTSQDCFYEHGTYHSGYRYYRRSIGSTYDNDAESYTLTILSQMKNGNSWQMKYRSADLNTNNRDRHPDNVVLGNTVSKVAEDLSQLDLQYRFPALSGALTFGGLLTKSTITNVSDTEYDIYLKYEFLF